ncbi:MAG: antitoxin VapB family protein [Candidatus Methanosuratincola petrocarbonis]
MVRTTAADEGYSTISVPPSVKRALQKAKGEREWGEYLMELYTENIRLKQEKAHEQLRELLSEEDLKRIEESSREFRRSFRIGEGRI